MATKKIDSKVKRGRPKWSPPNLSVVEDLAAKGLTIEQIAASLGIHKDTLYARQKDFSDFSDALARGRARGIESVANTIYLAAVNGNLQAAMFYLRSRASWSDRADATVVQQNIAGGVSQVLQDPKAQARAAAEELGTEACLRMAKAYCRLNGLDVTGG